MNNIFDFATSELSQDAFLCYWFNFATVSHSIESIEGCKSAQELLSLIIRKWKKVTIEPSEISVNKIVRQFNNIDMLLMVNDKYYILIEDKLYTDEHHNQITKYMEALKHPNSNLKKRIEDTFGMVPTDNNIIPVYFKMINQSGYDEKRYVPIKREEVLSILGKYNFEKKSILEMFKQYISEIEDEVINYQKYGLPDNWGYNQFSGFYSELEKSLETSKNFGYGKVNNKNGGFIGCWWFFLQGEDLKRANIQSSAIKEIYLQIQKNSKQEFQLAIKMNYVPSEVGREEYCFKEEIKELDKQIFETGGFSKRNRASLCVQRKEGERSIVTLWHTKICLEDISDVVQKCKDAEELLQNLSLK